MLIVSPQSHQRLQDCIAKALTAGTLDQFVDKLHYLSHYGENDEQWTAERTHSRCTLYNDFYQLSFGATMEVLRDDGIGHAPDETYRTLWVGGFIFDDRTATWSVHT